MTKLTMFAPPSPGRRPQIPTSGSGFSTPNGAPISSGVKSYGRAGGRKARDISESKGNRGNRRSAPPTNRSRGSMTFGLELNIGGHSNNNNSKIGETTSRSIYFDERNSSPVEYNSGISFPHYVDTLRPGSEGDSNVAFVGMDFGLFAQTVSPDYPFSHAAAELQLKFRDIIKNIRKEVQSAIFNDVDDVKLGSYFNDLTEALFLYYEADALMSYKQETGEKHYGIHMMQSAAGANTKLPNKQFELRRVLRGLACPPALFKLCQWLSQFYLSGESQKSAAIKLAMSPFYTSIDKDGTPFFTDEAYIVQLYDNLIMRLTSATNTKIIAPLLKTYPHWEIAELPLSDNKPCYDPRIVDIFSNQRTFDAKGKYYQGSDYYPAASNSIQIDTVQDQSDIDAIVVALLNCRDKVATQGSEVVPLGLVYPKPMMDPNALGINNAISKSHLDVNEVNGFVTIQNSYMIPNVTQRGDRFNAFYGTDSWKCYTVTHHSKFPIIPYAGEQTEVMTKQVVSSLFD